MRSFWLGVLWLTPCLAVANPWDKQPTNPATNSDHGGVGLLQMPSARMASEGEFAIGINRVDPYDRYSFTLQALKRFEFVFRYNSINNQLYGPRDFSGNLTLKDRGFDAKLTLFKESDWMPEVAVGARDFLGTGLFSSEYLVASKRYNQWDFTAGLMWGNIGLRQDVKNPLGALSSRFYGERERTGSVGGEANSNSWFKGQYASLFAGVEYRFETQPLWLVAEYDANDYRNEPRQTQLAASSPFNLGVKYRYDDWLDLGLAFERGNTLGFNIGFRTNFMDTQRGMPKFDAPFQPTAQPDITPSLLAFQRSQDNSSEPVQATEPAIQNLKRQLTGAGLPLQSLAMSEDGQRLRVVVSNKNYRNLTQALGRTSRILLAHTPSSVLQFTLVVHEKGLDVEQHTFYRHQLVQVMQKQLSPTVAVRYAQQEQSLTRGRSDSQSARPLSVQSYPNWTASIAPAMRHNIGGPDDFYQFQIMAVAPVKVELRPGLSVSSSITTNIYNTFDKIKLESDSVLPHVRSDIAKYLKQQGTFSLTTLQADYLFNVANGWYGRTSAGIFEEMFGGVGAEVLYAPQGKPWAFGLDANWVKQRDYDNRFGFLPYQANTGHVTWYHQWPAWQLQSKVSAGQYLAGDRGYTIDVSREFDNGTRVGGFFTRTNVSAAEFGEGSFDKGIYISIPLDFFTTTHTRGRVGSMWRPLTRDGGAKLNISNPLYDAVKGYSNTSMDETSEKLTE